MNWKKKFLHLKTRKKPFNQRLDERLLKNISDKKIPNLQQIKHAFKFLNSLEKKIVYICLGIATISSLLWLIFFINNNLVEIPKTGGEYIEAVVGQPKNINPLFSSTNDVDADLTSLVYSGLFKIDENNKIAPDLAYEYILSEDQKIYTIKLREDIYWHDKEKFDATDVLFTLGTIQDITVGSPLSPAFQGVKIEKIDDFTVSFTLQEPFTPFLNSLTVGILPEHIWNQVTPANIKLAKNNLQPIGTGAWKFNKLVKDDSGNIQTYILIQNESYYKEIPYLKTLIFKFYQTYEQALDALRNENVKAISFLPRKYKDKIPGKEFNLYQLQLPQYTSIFFNQKQNSHLKDYDLRLALALSIDKEKILKESLQDEGEVIYSPVLKNEIGYYPEIEKMGLDIDRANELLDETWNKIQPEEYFEASKQEKFVGYEEEIKNIKENPSSTPEMVSTTLDNINQEIEKTAREEMNANQSFYRKNKEGDILKITITTADTEQYITAAELIASMWRKIGVYTTVQSVSSKLINKDTIKERSYEILLYAEIIGSDPDLFPFWHSSQINYPGLNLSMFSDKDADKYLENARTATDDETRDELYKKFQDLLIEKLPAIFLYTPNYNFIASKELNGLETKYISSPSDRYSDINNWYIKTKKSWE